LAQESAPLHETYERVDFRNPLVETEVAKVWSLCDAHDQDFQFQSRPDSVIGCAEAEALGLLCHCNNGKLQALVGRARATVATKQSGKPL
jgi:hypothetical protein